MESLAKLDLGRASAARLFSFAKSPLSTTMSDYFVAASDTAPSFKDTTLLLVSHRSTLLLSPALTSPSLSLLILPNYSLNPRSDPFLS